ncbi:acyl carrier protein [Candidatus Thioglobus sp.]|jgi:acyl carrier protein|nr:acyl carrier protein [Candidatus Thioglobus sp.]
MPNEEKLKMIFSESLSIPMNDVVDNLEYNTIHSWDSLGHMVLVAKIEDAFDVMMETDDIIDMSSFSKAKEILFKEGIHF